MIINPKSLESIYFNLDTRFQGAFKLAKPWSDAIATQVPSSTAANVYPWLESIPDFRKWLGERQVRNLTARSYRLENEDYELTIAVKRNDIKDDNLGIYNQAADLIGERAKRWADGLIKKALQLGVSTICADGQFFFDNDHPVNQDNSGAGTYSNNFTSTPLNAANLDAVRTAMMQRVDAGGQSLEVLPDLLIVPPSLATVARNILNSQFIAPTSAFGGNAASIAASNPLVGIMRMLEVPQLANEPTTWYMADTTKPVKPLIAQLREPPVLTPMFALDDSNVFWRKEYIYGADFRGAAGFALPFLMARAIA